MKALREIPYPSASPDLSIFESWSDEYDGVPIPHAMLKQRSAGKVASSRNTDQPHNASGLLEQLSRRRKFAEAEEVRKELVGMNVPIRPSPVYYHAAWNVLRRRPWPPNRAELFANWLSLLPGKAENDKVTHRFYELKSALLFNSSKLDLESVVHFGVILSSKGYIRSVGAPVVACLTRFAHPDVSWRILDEMMVADNDYKRNKLRLTTEARYKDTSKRLWSIAVRTHCNAGRPEVALQMAKRAHERGCHLTQYTYQYLLGKLEADGLKEPAAEVRTFSGCQSLDVAKSRFTNEGLSTSNPILPISPKQHVAVNRALALANLKRNSQSGVPACVSNIVPYFDIYKTGLRGSAAVHKLRSRAYRVSLRAASVVLLAELLHHHRRGQFTHLLWVFEKFFHVVGVPAEVVTRRLWKRDHYPPHMRLHYWTLPPRITKTTFNLPSKLSPTAHHTSLVWTALVQLCENEEELFVLYDQLLERSAQSQQHLVARVERNRPQDQQQHGGSSTPIETPAERYDATHFRPFLIAFTLVRGAKHGLQVLDDMQDRGIAPSAQILSSAAALQARHGEPAVALRMLDVIRELHHSPAFDSDSGAKVEAGKQMLLAAYTAVLRGFLDRRALAQAQHVAELLRDRLEYVEGSGNARTDAALRFLRRLEVEGPDAGPDSLSKLDDDDNHCHRRFYPFLKKRDAEVGTFFFP
jgi:pentatricopeptide repeat protein